MCLIRGKQSFEYRSVGKKELAYLMTQNGWRGFRVRKPVSQKKKSFLWGLCWSPTSLLLCIFSEAVVAEICSQGREKRSSFRICRCHCQRRACRQTQRGIQPSISLRSRNFVGWYGQQVAGIRPALRDGVTNGSQPRLPTQHAHCGVLFDALYVVVAS
ncbi:hypothetical protein BGZ63DRAFT_386958 [Mariannaea sp. PMI_226]|nr:hypothetical protein BGZ63DRAFT_386958 [Mariannaea sp. PMI_226]